MTTEFTQKEEKCCVLVSVAISVTVILFLPTHYGDLFLFYKAVGWKLLHTHAFVYLYIHRSVCACCILFTHASGKGCQVLFLIKADTIKASIALHRYSHWNNPALCFISYIHIQNGIIKTFRRKRLCCWLYSRFQGIWDGIVVLSVSDTSLFISSRLVMTFWMVPIPSPLRRPVNLEAFKYRSSLDLM